jgi:hypothetical protein
MVPSAFRAFLARRFSYNTHYYRQFLAACQAASSPTAISRLPIYRDIREASFW